MLRKDPFLALYFSLFSSMIFQCLRLFLSAALFLCWQSGHLVLFPIGLCYCEDHIRSSNSTGALVWALEYSYQPEHMWGHLSKHMSLSSQWIPTKLTSIPTSVSIQLQLSLGSSSTALFSFLNMYLRLRPSLPRLKALSCISASSWGPSKDSLSLLYKAFFGPF